MSTYIACQKEFKGETALIVFIQYKKIWKQRTRAILDEVLYCRVLVEMHQRMGSWERFMYIHLKYTLQESRLLLCNIYNREVNLIRLNLPKFARLVSSVLGIDPKARCMQGKPSSLRDIPGLGNVVFKVSSNHEIAVYSLAGKFLGESCVLIVFKCVGVLRILNLLLN